MKGETNERHHPRRRRRHAAIPPDHGNEQAAAAGLRQADDLLPAVHADALGHPGHPHHLDPGGHTALRASPWRWRTVRTEFVVPSAAFAGRAGAGVPAGRGVHRG